MYAGHYYSEVTVIQMIQDGQIKEIDTWYWAYVVGFAVLLVLGACMQYQVLRKEERQKAREEAAKNPYSRVPGSNGNFNPSGSMINEMK